MVDIITIKKDIRQNGLNQGLPCWTIECGPGIRWSSEDVLTYLVKQGFRAGDLVYLKQAMNQRGLGVIIDGLSYIRAKIEVQANTADVTPSWFPKVRTWTVEWGGLGKFNIGALRAGSDILYCRAAKVEEMIDATKEFGNITKGVLPDASEETVWQYRLRMM